LYSEERDRVFDFSISHANVSYAVFVRTDTPMESPLDAKGKKIFVVKDVYAHDWLRQSGFTTSIIAVDTPQEALDRLSKGEHDCAILVRLHGLEVVQQLKIRNLMTIGPPVLSQKMGFAVKAGNADLLATLNEGIYLTQVSGAYDQIFLKWLSTDEPRRQIDHLMRLMRWGLLLLLALGGFGAFWIWMLRKHVAARTKDLDASRGLLHQIIDRAPLPTVVTDTAGAVSHWNEACVRATGIPAEKVIGRQSHTMAAHDISSVFLQAALQEFGGSGASVRVTERTPESDGETVTVEATLRLPGQAVRWLSGIVAPFSDDQGRPLGVIETWQDLTVRKRLEDRLSHAQKMESMGTLAGRVAHDFASYLQAISAHADIAREASNGNEPVMSSLGEIQATINRGRDLINQILLFSRSTSEHQEVIIPAKIVGPLVEMIETTAGRRIDVCTEITTKETVMGNQSQFGQVVLNLCNNAVQAMGEAGGTLHVELNDVVMTGAEGFPAEHPFSGRYVRLSVCDTGPGIPEDVLPNVFEPFFTTRKHNGGTGMGLAIVHGIVKAGGGQIRITRPADKGVCFEVLWPAAGKGGDLTAQNGCGVGCRDLPDQR
jgi:two-component system sensor histidine kinase EvgS